MTMLTLAQTPSAGGSVLSVLALCLALLALLCAGVLFVFLRKSNRAMNRRNEELQRRLREMEAAARRPETPDAALLRRLENLERGLDALDRALAQVERSLPRRAPAYAPEPEKTYTPAPAPQRDTAAAAPRSAPLPGAGRNADAPSEEERLLRTMNRVLCGAENPDRAMQRAFSKESLRGAELLHYVRPQAKLQDADYAEFCAYSRLNPSLSAVMKMGHFVVPCRISLDAPGLADWYEVERRSDAENPAPHFVLQRLALAQEPGQVVRNESGESKPLLTVARKGRLLACNL